MQKSKLHQRKRSEFSYSDEYETPDHIIHELSKRYGIFPSLDVACNEKNAKCNAILDDGLKYDWGDFDKDIWCNPPHSLTKEFVLRANEQWQKFNLNIMMIIPANSCTTKYLESVYDNIEIHPIFGRITFLVNKKPAPYPARNGYFVVIWRKRIY